MRKSFNQMLNEGKSFDKIPSVNDFYKNYINLSLQNYTRYWALFAFMYDRFDNVNSDKEIDFIFQRDYSTFKKKDQRYLDAWMYFASFKKQELMSKTKGVFIYENNFEQATLAFQLSLRDEHHDFKNNFLKKKE